MDKVWNFFFGSLKKAIITILLTLFLIAVFNPVGCTRMSEVVVDRTQYAVEQAYDTTYRVVGSDAFLNLGALVILGFILWAIFRPKKSGH